MIGQLTFPGSVFFVTLLWIGTHFFVARSIRFRSNEARKMRRLLDGDFLQKLDAWLDAFCTLPCVVSVVFLSRGQSSQPPLHKVVA